MATGRLIQDAAARGSWNMAIDEVLLESAAAGACTLRFYQWQPATLSLGYFQFTSERDGHIESRSCDLVRRSTGGGAILHDRELTYSFAAPISDRFIGSAESLYDAFHDTLIATLSGFGIDARRCGANEADAKTRRNQQFLCFERRSEGDVLLGSFKVGGSAQRRRRNAILQHGSILLGQSEYAPQLPGICELSKVELSANSLADAWLPLLLRQLRLDSTRGWLSEGELSRAGELMRGKYDHKDWLRRR